MRRRTQAARATCLLLLTTMASPVLPATAGSSSWDGDVPDGMEYDPAIGGLRGDLVELDASRAAASGMNYEETLGRLRATRDLDAAVNDLASKYPDTFAGMYWDDGLTLVVQFKGDVPKAAAGMLHSVGTKVEWESVKYSERELEKRSAETVQSIMGLGLDDYAVGTDPRSQTIYVTVGTSSLSSESSESAVAQLVRQVAADNVQVEVVDGPTHVDLSALGGAEMWDGMVLDCTTGFTVQSGTTTGTSTAGHCGFSAGEYYWDPFIQDPYDLTYKSGSVGTWGDFEWLTTPTTELDNFYHTAAGAVRDVSGVMNSMSVGQVLAWYGRKTKTEFFGTVGFVNVSLSGAGHLACMNQSNGDVGDSGGPVYSSSLAAGHIKGKGTFNGALRLCFSQARYIDDAIGVSIKTT